MNRGDIKSYLYIGIDTGKGGGICLISESRVSIYKCGKSIHDMSDQLRIALELSRDVDVYCCIEKNHSWSGQGVKSTWTFGHNSGAWEGILSAYNIPYELVTPQKWMRWVGVPTKMEKRERKNWLKDEAIRRYPHYKKLITLATADAVLIATYARDRYR